MRTLSVSADSSVRPFPASTTPAEYAEVLKAQAADAVEDERQAQEDIRALAQRRQALRFAARQLSHESGEIQSPGRNPAVGTCVFINGFVPKVKGEAERQTGEEIYLPGGDRGGFR